MLKLLLSSLFYPAPSINIDEEQEKQFKKLVDTMMNNRGELIDYPSNFPKYHFIKYMSQTGKFVFHGSNNHDIEIFEPREQTLYNNKLTKAIFASTDPIWPIFYAVLRRDNVVASFRNGCLVHRNQRYHYYSLNQSTIRNDPWTEGMLYILPNQTFFKSGNGRVQFDEWISHEPVAPIGKIPVSVDDFFYHNKVSVHKDGESLWKTWFLYKIRTLRANSKMAARNNG
ncbi:hypothetical protein [Caldalkalibacillus mannanilyticus]|uniref:hypothetical protein n=1 Tax=Caldalkalibacillus mannanilyticus TaxID=1418 RepID=UPI0004685779|nr:hypothetical protein [Caldalkalibacillus mannanilyticus]